MLLPPLWHLENVLSHGSNGQKWYTKKEMNLRMSIFYSGAMIAGAFGNLIAAGILDGLAEVRGLSAWRWLYIIEGSSMFRSFPRSVQGFSGG